MQYIDKYLTSWLTDAKLGVIMEVFSGEQMNNPNGVTTGSMPFYNLKAVVKQTGLNPATIRAWERRYGFPRPQRTEGGHRQYTQQDIETLKWLVARQEEGISISHAIDLWHSYIERDEDPLQGKAVKIVEPAIAQPVVGLEGKQIDQIRQAWITACLSFDRETAEQVLTRAFAQFSPEVVCVEVLQKGLAEVGNAWYKVQATIQQEHFTSALSTQRLEMLIAAAPPPTHPERIVVATAPGDYHVFSPLLITYLLRRRGWDVIYLGANVPVEELESTIEQIQPELVIVSAQRLHTAATLKDIALAVHSLDSTLAFGGLIFNSMPELQKLIPGQFLGETLEEAVQQAVALINRPASDIQYKGSSETHQRALAQYRERRALIESHVWGTFVATNKPTGHLTAINDEFGKTIESVLKLGDVSLLQNDITWIEHLLMGYGLSRTFILDYILAYYQAAKIHLGESAGAIVEWLSQLIISQERLSEGSDNLVSA
jgi:DNA-binding transcriptional MerR regulator/methylmalonyl-CoA mutase cobalamin-binding subunit